MTSSPTPHVFPPQNERKVLELVRVSTRSQRDRETSARQTRQLDTLREQRGGTFYPRVNEQGVSGATPLEKREFVRAIYRYINGPGLNEIRVVEWDRVTRLDAADCGTFINDLRDAGVVLYDATEKREFDLGDEKDRHDIISMTQTACRARSRIIRLCTDGRNERVERGIHPQGAMPWGLILDRDTEVYSWDPKVIEILVFAAGLLASGFTLVQTCDALQLRGDLAPGGKSWGRGGMLCKAIRADCYLGRWHGTLVAVR